MDGFVSPTTTSGRTNVVQHMRSILPNSSPGPGTLLEGEFAIVMPDPMTLWVGVPVAIDATGRKQLPVGRVFVGDTPPTAAQGTLWFNSLDTQLYVYYLDPTGPGQWVVSVNPSQATGTGGGGGGGGIPEAPSDNHSYGRINQSWGQVIAASGDVIDGGNF